MRIEYFQLIDRIVDLNLNDLTIRVEANVPTDGHLVHSMEHGFVVVWYQPAGLPATTVDGLRDLAWFTVRGSEMTERDWYEPAATLGMYLSGRDIPGRDERGAPIVDDSFLAVLHAGDRPVSFVLPGPPWAERYEVVVDTSREEQSEAPGTTHPAGAAITVPARAVLLLRVAG